MPYPEKIKLAEFKDWLDNANVGQTIIYHTGNLAIDRGNVIYDAGVTSSGKFLYIHNEIVEQLAVETLNAFEEGKVHLFQRKIHDNEYQYIAMKRSRHNLRGFLR